MLRGEELVPHREFTLEGKGLREWFLATFPSGFGCERRSLIERLGVFQEFDRIYLACQPVEYWLGLESLGRLMVRFEGGAERAPSESLAITRQCARQNSPWKGPLFLRPPGSERSRRSFSFRRSFGSRVRVADLVTWSLLSYGCRNPLTGNS